MQALSAIRSWGFEIEYVKGTKKMVFEKDHLFCFSRAIMCKGGQIHLVKHTFIPICF